MWASSLSAYFAQNSWEATLLDLSDVVILRAKEAFKANNLEAEFVAANCLDMPFEDSTFDAFTRSAYLNTLKTYNQLLKSS